MKGYSWIYVRVAYADCEDSVCEVFIWGLNECRGTVREQSGLFSSRRGNPSPSKEAILVKASEYPIRDLYTMGWCIAGTASCFTESYGLGLGYVIKESH